MNLTELSFDQLETEAARLGVNLPIEQTQAWATYEDTIPGRTQWGCASIGRNGKTVALIAFADYETHGYHYLRAHHAPVWVSAPTPDEESEALLAIRDYVRARDKKVVFVRLSVTSDAPQCRPVLSTIPYDMTVVIDVTGGDEEILSRMKPRGRRDVRKALREAPVTCADETEQATADFSEYYAIMRETGERDGFEPAPMSDYEDIMSILGPAHVRLFAGRDPEGRVVTWSMDTISGTRGVRYYAGSSSATMRLHVTDKLLYFELCELGRLGCEDVDLMAIGSDFSPALLGLNAFKTKFCKEGGCSVAPDRDLPVRPLFYASLEKAKRLMNARRGADKDVTPKDAE